MLCPVMFLFFWLIYIGKALFRTHRFFFEYDMNMYYVTKNYTFHLKYSSCLCKPGSPPGSSPTRVMLNLYLSNIPKHIKLQYIKVIILESFKIFNRENPINRINQLFTSTMLKSHLKFKSPKIKEIINIHINTCIC